MYDHTELRILYEESIPNAWLLYEYTGSDNITSSSIWPTCVCKPIFLKNLQYRRKGMSA
jgi:hypothetical protein